MRYLQRIINSIVLILAANLPFLDHYLLPSGAGGILIMAVLLAGLLFLIMRPSISNRSIPKKQLRICADGCELLICFLISTTASVIGLICMITVLFPGNRLLWILDLVCVIIVEAATFWCGILRIYLTSLQIGMKWRVIGIACGWIPVVNLFVLFRLIRIASEEWKFESRKLIHAQEHKEEQLCRTRYPILMVHGVFFRDFKYFNYWGRIPKELETHGAKIFYGNHQSAAAVADSGQSWPAGFRRSLQRLAVKRSISLHTRREDWIPDMPSAALAWMRM